jgi:hypothetical protein
MPTAGMYNFVEVSGHNLESHRLKVPGYKVYHTNQFQINFALGWGGRDPLEEVTVNSKQENS